MLCLYICGLCTGVDHLQNLMQFREEMFTQRILTKHLEDCDTIESDPSKSKELGINRRSILLDLQYFDICQGLLPDVMHDLLEGALQYEVKLLLNHCIGQCYFTLTTLNEKIDSVDIDVSSESDRPVTIASATLKSKDNLLKQKGNSFLNRLETCS